MFPNDEVPIPLTYSRRGSGIDIICLHRLSKKG